MATPPTRSGGAPLPGPEASADAASLRAYLARDTHARVSRLSADEFTSWLERETLERLHRDRPAALRARAAAAMPRLMAKDQEALREALSRLGERDLDFALTA